MRGEPWFLSRNVAGEPNARTRIRLCEIRDRFGRFAIEPETGKQHQVRLHMAQIGCPIKNDYYYPELQASQKVGFDKPLQLLAKELRFMDPVSRQEMLFRSERELEWLSGK